MRRAYGATTVAHGCTRQHHGARRTGATSGSYIAKDEIRSRIGSVAAPLRPEHTFWRAAEIWLIKLDAGLRGAATAYRP